MSKKALFLDRDGIINEEKNYVHRIEDFHFVEGIFDLLRYAQSLGYLLIVVTNQAGIARGYYTENDFRILNEWMLRQFEQERILIDQVYYCPYHPLHGIGSYKKHSEFRKPAPGMILQAKKEFEIELSGSLLIGDKESDIEAGIRAGLGQTILLRTSRYHSTATKADLVIDHLTEVKPMLKK